MKNRLIQILVLFVVTGSLLLGCNGDDSQPTVIDVPTVSFVNENPDVIDQPPIVTIEASAEVNEAGEADEVPANELEAPVEEGTEVVQEPVVEEPIEEAAPEDSPVLVTSPSTIVHEVQVGEWLMQLARCYGTSYSAIRQANPELLTPNYIMPGTMVTIPDAGSVGDVSGAPCVAEYTVMLGDSWSGLAERFGTTAVILQRVNPGPLWAGDKIIVPTTVGGQ